MVKELDEFDVSSFRALAEVRQEEKALRALIEKANAQKEQVNRAVYERVMKDYSGRLQSLDTKAQPLCETARVQLKKLQDLRDRLKAALDAAQLDYQELEFRLQVGELQPKDFEPRKKTLAEALSTAQGEYDEVERVCQQFGEIVPPEATPVRQPSPPQAVKRMTVHAKGKPEDVGDDPGTIVDSPGEMRPAKEVSPDFATLAVSLARLVQEKQGRTALAYDLGAIANIGRIHENHVALDKPEVSRHHARISMTETGWLITDLDSGNGTFVNDKRVKSESLKDGDKIRIGTTEFVFKTKSR